MRRNYNSNYNMAMRASNTSAMPSASFAGQQWHYKYTILKRP